MKSIVCVLLRLKQEEEEAFFPRQRARVFVVCFALTVFGSSWRPATILGKVGSQQQQPSIYLLLLHPGSEIFIYLLPHNCKREQLQFLDCAQYWYTDQGTTRTLKHHNPTYEIPSQPTLSTSGNRPLSSKKTYDIYIPLQQTTTGRREVTKKSRRG